MQGQRSAVGSLPDSINTNYGSSPNTVGVDEQIFWNGFSNSTNAHTEHAGQDGQNTMRWSFSNSSSTIPENPVNHDEQMTQSASSRLEEWRYEAVNPVSQAGVGLNLNINQIVGVPSFMCASDSASSVHSQNMNPFGSSSRSSGLLLDDDDGRPCKRKTLEGNVGQSSTSIDPHVQVNPRLGLDLGGGVSTHGSLALRLNMPDQQDSTPSNPFGHPDVPPVPRSFRNVNPPLDLALSIPPDVSVRQNRPVILRGPTLRRNVHSSSSAMSRDRDNVVSEDSTLRNASRSVAMLVGPGEGRSFTQNVGSTSRNPAGPSWGSYPYPPSEYSRRLSEYIRRSVRSTVANARRNGGNSQQQSGLASSQESIHPSNVRFPNSVRDDEGRSRLVSEIRNALDIMRRGEGLRFEDAMVLNPSVFFGMPAIRDRHRDMRLDVDNMSYEELLALEERIGNVSTGLSEETILKRMKQHKFIYTSDDDNRDSEPCCVCQETYNDGEDLGVLDCGHNFHTECIKQWLVQKNLCPICKTTALAT